MSKQNNEHNPTPLSERWIEDSSQMRKHLKADKKEGGKYKFSPSQKGMVVLNTDTKEKTLVGDFKQMYFENGVQVIENQNGVKFFLGETITTSE